MPITETQRLVLAQAAEHPAGLALPSAILPPAPRAAVARALLKAGLLVRDETNDQAQAAWTWKLDGDLILLAITEAGRQALVPTEESMTVATGDDGEAGMTEADIKHELDLQHQALDPAAASSTRQTLAAARHGLRQAAGAVLAAWDAQGALEAPLVALRAALAKPTRVARPATAPLPRQGTKQAMVLALLRQPEGTTVTQIAEAAGWQPHTVRGFFAGLKQRGLDLQVVERVRQIGPGQQGAKGSYSIYRLVDAG